MRPNRPEDLWRRVDVRGTGDCWPWLGTTRPNGYGQFSLRGRNVATHRLAYELSHGAIPSGLVVRHTCDNPPCCNPAHLLVGTVAENSQDMVDRGRAADRRGSRHHLSKLTEAEVIEIRRRREAGERVRVLAAEFGVSNPTICRVAKRYGWTHIQEGVAA